MAQPYANPYLAGIGLGLVLLAAFVLVGRGLGASGALDSAVAWLASLVAPALRAVERVPGRLPRRRARTRSRSGSSSRWLGVFVGALLSGLLAGRVACGDRAGPARLGRDPSRPRVRRGRPDGGFGAAFARGCTSGQALTGGALLNLGSWVFMMCVFGGAYAVALLVRRQWR